MRLLQLIILALLFFSASCTQEEVREESHPFPYLDEIKSSEFNGVYLYLDKTKAEIFDKKLANLDKDHPLYMDDDCESTMVLLAITELDKSGKKYAILYGYCPEPEFDIYDANDLGIHYGAVSGERLYITGNGNLYVSGSVNSNFNAKRKYNFKENDIKEVEQPFYDVSLKTKTLNPITLYKTKDLKQPLASLPADYPVEVVLAEKTYGGEELYLIKTDFGLLGWAKLRATQAKSTDVEGIFWNGD